MRLIAFLLFMVVAARSDDRVVLQQLGELWLDDQFARYDRDADGRLSVEEAKPIALYVAGADSDANGAITHEELRAHFRERGMILQAVVRKALSTMNPAEIEARFRKLDKDGDGKLATEELAHTPGLSRLASRKGGLTLGDVADFFKGLANVTPPATDVAPPMYRPEETSPRQAPRRVRPNDAGIGRMIPDFLFTDLEGVTQKFSDVARNEPTIIALVSSSCPVSKRYLPSLAQLADETKGSGVRILLVAATATDTADDLRLAFRNAGLNVPCAIDRNGVVCRTIGATVSTDVLVLDAKRTLIYRGALDDQYGLGYSLDAPRHRYAAEAVKAVIAGRIPEVQATEAPGCVLDIAAPERSQSTQRDITYHNRISRILLQNCVECHRSGGVAPFPLETFEQLNAKAGMVRRTVERRLMPPWFAAPPPNGEHSPWRNDRSLPEADRADLLAWLDAGKVEGDFKDAPLARVWPDQWQIGVPDAVFQLSDPIEVKATGTMPYQNVIVKTGLESDRWVNAIEIQPTSRDVVHHVIVSIRGDSGPLSARRISADDESGGFFAAYVPGNDHVIYPDGFAKKLPANAILKFQIHYTPSGVATRDQTKIAMRFTKDPPKHTVHVAGIQNHRISIPPEASNHAEGASLTVPRDVAILGFMPHLHVRGKAFRYELVLAGKAPQTLLDVPRYDFNWQLAYRYGDPVFIPAGAEIRVTAWYDNSRNNPANPDPSKTVRWGPQTTDEMMLGYVEYYLPGPAKVASR